MDGAEGVLVCAAMDVAANEVRFESLKVDRGDRAAEFREIESRSDTREL